jgi:hypothetical protein
VERVGRDGMECLQHRLPVCYKRQPVG